MSFYKILPWFLTEAGKKFSYLAAGTGSTVVLLGHFLPHTLLLDQYKDIVHLYKNGFTVSLSAVLHKRFQKALELVGIEERDKHLFKPFPVFGFDVFSAGSSYSQYGVVVGLPINFTYENPDTVDKSAIKLGENSITWDTDAGKQLLNSLILSENAQLYAMAREIKFRETPKTMIDTVTSVVCFAGAYGLGHTINVKQNLYARPLIVRLVLYSLVSLFATGTYLLAKDSSQVYYEGKIDKELREKDPIFKEGGKEFYTKILQRNIALRSLLGKQGEKAFTILGNENYFLRYKHIPLVQRKVTFEESS